MSECGHAVVLVDSTSHALRAEKVLNELGIPNKLIPVPRHLSSDCGVCLRIERRDEEQVRALLQGAGVGFSAIHPM
ncbi:MAG: DUF3343 domain-containing protein [Anaerolineales bacterium]|nr:MAG: DUF3343 domain-containing protein [Anaerolineales bacterium]